MSFDGHVNSKHFFAAAAWQFTELKLYVFDARVFFD
jgi:hypothetical protein